MSFKNLIDKIKDTRVKKFLNEILHLHQIEGKTDYKYKQFYKEKLKKLTS
ncbi:hypothetical protein HN450_03745 [bacterium]|jgi:hypothetical protein|nr:hypothetical protein [bacterium]MBT3850422.1 hypothetical protein [bacterium]